jgi:uncharacterized YceG family protein
LSRGDRSREQHERTSEERERDREERERRRAARGAGVAPPASELPPAPPIEEPPVSKSAPESAPSHETGAEPEPERPPEPEPETRPEELWEAPEVAPERFVAPAHPVQSPVPLEQPPAYAPPADDPGADAPQEEDPDELSASQEEHPETSVGEHLEERLQPPVPPPVVLTRPSARGHVIPASRKRTRRAPLARVAAIVALAAVLVALVLVVKALHGESKPKAPAAPVAVKVLIPEGKTRVQIAQIAATVGLKGSYRVASRSSSLLNPSHYGAPHDTPDLEGFLFPATYDMDPGESAARLVAKQLTAFQENFGVSEIARARALHVTPYQLLIVASMVEREAQVPGDRAKIAAVIYNRLRAGMPLGIDASIYYAVELEKGVATYTHELSESDLHIDSPYNTRTHRGLPPTPISNPGVASIQAAAHPAHASYLYYVAGADGCGEQIFSTSQTDFEANAAAYDAAVKKNGGHPPTCKHK